MKKTNSTNIVLIIIVIIIFFSLISYFAFVQKTKTLSLTKNNSASTEQVKKQVPQHPIAKIKQAKTSTTTGIIIQDKATNSKIYRNEKYGFEIKFPQNTKIEEENNQSGLGLSIKVPITPSTTMTERDMYLSITENSTPQKCFDETLELNPVAQQHETTEINGIKFYYFITDDAAMGQSYHDESYCTIKDNNCIKISFSTMFVNPYNYDPEVRPSRPSTEDLNINYEIFKSFKFLK